MSGKHCLIKFAIQNANAESLVKRLYQKPQTGVSHIVIAVHVSTKGKCPNLSKLNAGRNY
jgi:hypothetical protein